MITVMNSSRHSSANSSVTFECDEMHHSIDGQRFAAIMPLIDKKNNKTGKMAYSVVESLTADTDSFRDMTILLRKKTLIIRILIISIFLMLPFLVSNLISSIETERTLLLFETNFFCMKVKTMASLENCDQMEKIRKTVLQDWYE
jgi:hypothetical protein